MTIWTAPAVHREAFPPIGADERAALECFLDFHRDTLLLKCSGLTGGQLAARPLAITNLSLLGLVRHLTDVERFWFRRRFGPEPDIETVHWTNEIVDADFERAVADRAEADFAAYADEIKLAREVAAGRSLDEEFPARNGPLTLRWIHLQMIMEYARHAGHADLLRQAIDGVTGV